MNWVKLGMKGVVVEDAVELEEVEEAMEDVWLACAEGSDTMKRFDSSCIQMLKNYRRCYIHFIHRIPRLNMERIQQNQLHLSLAYMHMEQISFADFTFLENGKTCSARWAGSGLIWQVVSCVSCC
jgi:hypothetical protein